jgi:cell wall-associated NlpC family hydrolase
MPAREIPPWVASYIGIPFADRGRDRAHGLDCYGLLRLFMREQFGICVPSYAENYVSCGEHREIARLIAGELPARWDRLERGQEATGDAVGFGIGGAMCHVGIVVAPGWFLHVKRGASSCLEEWGRPQWVKMLMGFWRHR